MITPISIMTIREIAERKNDLLVSVDDFKTASESAAKRAYQNRFYLRDDNKIKVVQNAEDAYILGQLKAWKEVLEYLKCDDTEDCTECIFYDYNDDMGQLVTYCTIKKKAAELEALNRGEL